jgi:hypothetical protein
VEVVDWVELESNEGIADKVEVVDIVGIVAKYFFILKAISNKYLNAALFKFIIAYWWKSNICSFL